MILIFFKLKIRIESFETDSIWFETDELVPFLFRPVQPSHACEEDILFGHVTSGTIGGRTLDSDKENFSGR